MSVYSAVDRLVDYAVGNLCLSPRDVVYARNTVLGILGADAYPGDSGARCGGESAPDALLAALDAACIETGLFGADEREKYNDAVMGALSLSPSAAEELFHRKFSAEGAKSAADWLYDYSVRNNYVQKAKLDADPRFEAEGLIVTVNKAKPEFRDPQKAASGNAVRGGYPRCTICRENEGFFGRSKRTLRTVGIRLGGEKWFWQFSPYGYFYRHGIAVNEKHVPMHIDRQTFVRLLDFVDLFPHYFIGCNAPLPRIGGSVLAHDHYQGGGETLPLQRAGAAIRMQSGDFPGAAVDVLDWPGTAVRVSGSRDAVIELSDRIRIGWENYRNDGLGIFPFDGEGAHNAVSPTAVRTDGGYAMNIILRSNITSAQYPDGVFHAHPEFHAVKKESIGLIEAQGLFILPGRLSGPLAAMEDLLVAGSPLSADMQEFSLVYRETKGLCPARPSRKEARRALERELAGICRRILENTAVFKRPSLTAEFLKGLGFVCHE